MGWELVMMLGPMVASVPLSRPCSGSLNRLAPPVLSFISENLCISTCLALCGLNAR
uniref:Uncharacterized protein n=1 Tax=Aegilops tauschii subsp. strangulata TaxID=200361 RepID=A0A453SMK6_AEGTS